MTRTVGVSRTSEGVELGVIEVRRSLNQESVECGFRDLLRTGKKCILCRV